MSSITARCASSSEAPPVHLHLIELDSDHWRSWIEFRDALGSDERLRQRYGALKLELATRYAMDPSLRRRWEKPRCGTVIADAHCSA